MKILTVNRFLMPKGGSEAYIIQIGNCLGQTGHGVQYFGTDEPGRTLGNRINQYTPNMDFHTRGFDRPAYLLRVLHSRKARQRLMQVLKDFQSDAVRINNFSYRLTSSILYGIRNHERRSGKRAAVLYTTHNYQPICSNHIPNSLGGGQNCELCVDGYYVSYVRKRCIHLPMAKSLLGVAEEVVHRKLKVYRYTDRVICLSYFMEEKMNHVDLSRDGTIIMHNFAVRGEEVPGVKEDYILYFGRYSREKGTRTLLKVYRKLSDISFVPIGAGPLEDRIRGIPGMKNLGFIKGGGLNRPIREARFNIYPLGYYESCPFSVIESQLLGTSVLGARIGGIPKLVQEGVNGALPTNGDLGDPKGKIRYLWDRSQLCAQWFDRCRDISYDTVEMYCNKLLESYGADREG